MDRRKKIMDKLNPEDELDTQLRVIFHEHFDQQESPHEVRANLLRKARLASDRKRKRQHLVILAHPTKNNASEPA
jgi:hypothetical protein